MIDLHCHSHFSDGALSPADLIEKALENELKVIALTDHDTTAGLAELHLAAENKPIQIINGIELSTRWKKHDIHILGLNINPDHSSIQELIVRQNESRIQRAQDIAEKMTLCGVSDAYEKACDLAGHPRVGRPHFAQVFVNEGITPDRQAAFKRFLGRGKIAYVPTPWISIQEAVEGINSAGGDAVIAHPLKYSLTRTKLHELVTEFKMACGSGLEVISGEMTVTQIKELAGLCIRFDLLASSGSDYHGDSLSQTSLGRQRQLPINCMPVWHKWTITANRGL